MKTLFIILLLSFKSFGQDSVTARVTHVAEKTVMYKVNGMKFVSFDCKCDSLKRGMEFKIPKARFDSLLLKAKPIRRKDI